MNKKLLCLIFSLCVFSSFALFISGCGENTSNEGNTSNNSSSTENSSTKIVSDGGPVWTKEEHAVAENFANEFVALVKNKDLTAISKRVAYPITTKVNGKTTTINDEKEFSSLNFDDIFTNELVQAISNTTKLFSNQYGFMLGQGSNVWFSPFENGEMQIYAINN